MSAETSLYSALLAAGTVTAIVGSGSNARIYPDLVPLDVDPPYVAYSRTSTEFVLTIHSGTPVAEDATIEIMCMDTTKAGADALADAVAPVVGAAGYRLISRASVAPDPEAVLSATTLTVVKFSTL